MKTNKTHRFEKIFYATLAALVGVSFGYYWAAASAAENFLSATK